MKHRILLMVRELHHGGSERQVAEVALALDRDRFEPHVGVFRTGGARSAALEQAGIPIVHFPVPSFKSSALTGAWALARYVRTRSISLVHTFDLPLTAFGIPVARFFTPAVALASQRCHLGIVGGGMRRALVFAERIADGVVVNCEFLKHHLVEDAGIPPGRIHLCRNGIDLALFRRTPRPRPASLPPDALTIGVVCVLRPEKGLSTLLEAFALVRNCAASLRLVIVGGGPMLPDLERQARQLGIAGLCRFEPPTSEVPDWLGNIDIFVLPSLSEAFSNSLMEAMACGCCPIASRVGGNPELVEDGVRGLLFEPGDPRSLACALERVIRDPVLRRRLAGSAHDHLHANYSRDASAHRMAGIYAELLERKQPHGRGRGIIGSGGGGVEVREKAG